MELFNIDSNIKDLLNDVNEKLESGLNKEADLSTGKRNIEGFWQYLVTCESYFLNGDYKENYHHDYENMTALYFLNELIDKNLLTRALRDVLGIPPSKITTEMLEEWSDGWVAGDGTLYVISKYCQLDVGWFLSLGYYILYKVLPFLIHPFGTNPEGKTKVSNNSIPPSAKIAIIGDWGTGIWSDGETPKCPSQLVMEGVISEDPDYIIHLGDVYYAGTKGEETSNFLERIPLKYKGKFYTMNSNHEMYDGANGLMKNTLKDARFTHQNQTTYFSFEIGEWIIVGLDSAYYDESPLYMDGIIATKHGGQEQLEFLTKAYNSGKKVFLCTHHNGIEVDKNGPKPNNPMWDQILGATAPHIPDVWYWGHVHNGIVYNDNLSIYGEKKTRDGNGPLMRCCGHASIPFGNAPYLQDLINGPNPEVLYYSHTKMPPPLDKQQQLRVKNGFAIVELSGDQITETFYEVAIKDGKFEKTQCWSSAPA
ncbi:metallophosphoesterase [Aureisphaera galaxeae]|uniref:metallophosphoesterase family protein n=1 Tax=Aureisphaera galaxeae TaxID=1538023 RepID=UPI00235015C6|nr:metallophosphoesterase [Aureisphaera galaxeae]MDC8004338.1 metallophosphoesterase [Aureisphaera galaxeae]